MYGALGRALRAPLGRPGSCSGPFVVAAHRTPRSGVPNGWDALYYAVFIMSTANALLPLLRATDAAGQLCRRDPRKRLVLSGGAADRRAINGTAN